jgi:hypothetical protein
MGQIQFDENQEDEFVSVTTATPKQAVDGATETTANNNESGTEKADSPQGKTSAPQNNDDGYQSKQQDGSTNVADSFRTENLDEDSNDEEAEEQ